MNDGDAILSLESATFPRSAGFDTGLFDVTFRLGAGELLMVRLEAPNFRVPLGDAVAGLLTPIKGHARYMGESWDAMRATRAARHRGTIGRLFDQTTPSSWLQDRSLEENLLLATLHHSHQRGGELLEEAGGLARVFGLPGLPRFGPRAALEADLRRAACVRAFLGQPRLLILERPTAGVGLELLGPLVQCVQRARERGSAVIWTTSESVVFDEPAVRATRRSRMSGSQLVFVQSAQEPLREPPPA